MTTHSFKIVLVQRRSSIRNSRRTPAPRLASAARLLSSMTNIGTGKCTIIINEGMQFRCDFRVMTQYHETLLDYGYRAFVVTRYNNDNDTRSSKPLLTATKFKNV